MKKYVVRFSKKAKSDLEKIGDYIAFELTEPGVALKIIEQISKKCEKLNIFPKGNPVRISIDEINFRFSHFGNYTIIYNIDDSKSEVLIRAIVYSKRNFSQILKEAESTA